MVQRFNEVKLEYKSWLWHPLLQIITEGLILLKALFHSLHWESASKTVQMLGKGNSVIFFGNMITDTSLFLGKYGWNLKD